MMMGCQLCFISLFCESKHIYIYICSHTVGPEIYHLAVELAVSSAIACLALVAERRSLARELDSTLCCCCHYSTEETRDNINAAALPAINDVARDHGTMRDLQGKHKAALQ